jgi:hypothetical protein
MESLMDLFWSLEQIVSRKGGSQTRHDKQKRLLLPRIHSKAIKTITDNESSRKDSRDVKTICSLNWFWFSRAAQAQYLSWSSTWRGKEFRCLNYVLMSIKTFMHEFHSNEFASDLLLLLKFTDNFTWHFATQFSLRYWRHQCKGECRFKY